MDKANQKINTQFCLLSALGILMVVDGHLGSSYLDVGGLIQYYFFHMQMFVFISGYFYKGCKNGIRSYAVHKFLHLMVPYFIWNFIYGVLAQWLRNYGFQFGEPVTFRTLFVEPFCMGYQFVLNHVAWFVPTLFLVEMANALLAEGICQAARRVSSLGKDVLKYEVWIRTGLYMLISMGGVWVSEHVGTEGFWLMTVRVMFLLAFFGAGSLYRERLEPVDTLRNRYYFPLFLCAAMALALQGKPLIYGLWNCRDIPGYALPYAAAFVGIGFWLRVARILAPALEESRLVRFLGRNTYAVMMHHMMVFFLIKTAYAFLAKYRGMFVGFDFVSYKTDFYYCYLPRGMVQFKVFYLLAGIGLPLGFQWCVLRAKERIRSRIDGKGR